MAEVPDVVFEPARSTRALDMIIEQVRSLIRQGALRPGDRLPSERFFAVQLGVSRNTLREALRMLEISGLITLKKGATGGAFIATGDPAVVSRSVVDMLGLAGFSLASLSEARMWIEPTMIAAVCERATDEDLAKLDANVRQAEKHLMDGDPVMANHVNLNFHILLAEASKNAVMAMVMRSLLELRREYAAETIGMSRDPQTVIAERREFMRLLHARDAAGATAELARTLGNVHDRWLSIMKDKPAASGGD